MTPVRDLYHLIRSLSMSEKRYIKLMLKRRIGKEGKNNLRLFDELFAQKEFNEPAIRNQCKGQIKNFSSTKSQLYSFILTTLRLFHSRSSGDNFLLERLQEIEILHSKGLCAECDRLIKKSIVSAAHYANPLAQAMLLNWEARIRGERKYEDITSRQIEELHKNEIQVLEQYETVIHYRTITDRFFCLQFRDMFVRSGKLKYEAYPGPAFSALKKNNLSIDARIKMYFAIVGYYLGIGDHKNSFKYNNLLIAMIESLPYHTSEMQRHYINALFNLCVVSVSQNKFDQANQAVKKIQGLKGLSDNNKLTVTGFFCFLQGNRLVQLGSFKKAAKNADELAEYIEKNKYRLDNAFSLTLHYLIACSYFGNNQFSKAIEWSNKILNQIKTDRRVDLFLSARVLIILAHIEKGNYDVAVYLGKSFNRVLFKNSKLNRIKNALVEFIRKRLYPASLNRTISEREIQKAYIEFKYAIEKLIKDPFEKNLLNYFDILSWVQGKIENKTYGEVIRRKSK
ncbi:MAG TPA: hypothetical protein VII99_10915 [Bacteroidia bacterium]